MLLLHAGRVAAVDHLVDRLWADDPPASARKNVHGYVSRLRHLLGDCVQTRPPGYRLVLDGHSSDVAAFGRLVGQAHAARRAGEWRVVAGRLDDALRLWRGPALADLTAAGLLRPEAAALAAQRVSALEDHAEAGLELGHHQELVPRLADLVAEFPLNERLRALQMVALQRCSLVNLADAEHRRGDVAAARGYGREAFELFTRLGDARGLAEARRISDRFDGDSMGNRDR